jgi:DNA-binding NarL/FixJ family response regulator
MLSMHQSERYLDEAIRAGACGYVVKASADRDLVDACRAALRGERFVRSHPAAPAVRRTAGLPIHVLLVDDHPAVRRGLRRLLETALEPVAVTEVATASEVTPELVHWADVAAIDYHLGDRDGLWLTQQIKRYASPPPVLMYSAFADAALAAAAIVAGADAVLSKSVVAEELSLAIRRLIHGRQYLPYIPRSLVGALQARLDPGDRVLFSMLLDRRSAGEIKRRLGLSAAELDVRRRTIARAISPSPSRASLMARPGAPLDYEHARRRRSYPATG